MLIRRLSLLLPVLTVAALRAQTATSPAQPDQPATQPGDSTRDQVVLMSDFTVAASAQTGYTASETMSGSRIPTDIKDLPYNIDIVTSEFLDDFHIDDPSTMLNGGVVTLDRDAGNSYTVRGISATGQLYNGFWQPAGIPIPTALIDRREVIKGPNAGAYGQTSPGGILNIVSKTPKSVPQQILELDYGDYQTREARLTATGPLNSNTAYLAIISYDESGFVQPLHLDKEWSEALSLTHKFDDGSDLKVDLVGDTQRNRSPVNRVPYLFNSKEATPVVAKDVGYYTGYDLNLEDQNFTGPNSYSNTDGYSVFGVYERRLGDIFSLRVGGDGYANNNRQFDTSAITAYDPNPADANSNPYNSSYYGIARFRNSGSSYSAPSYKVDNKDGGGAQMDLLAHYNLANDKIENRTLLTFDYASMYEYIIKKGMPQQGTLSADGTTVSTKNAVDTTIIPATPQYAGDTSYYVPVVIPANGIVYNDPTTGLPVSIYNVPSPSSSQYILTSWQKARTDDFGTMLRQQSTLFQKLLIYAATRFDNVTYNNFTIQYPSFSTRDFPQIAWQNAYNSKNTNPIAHYHSDAFTPSAGFSYRVTPDVSLYGNYSTSFMASTQQVTGATTGSYFLPNQRAVGYDYGLKAGMLNDSLTYTLGGFYILQKNMAVTSVDALGDVIEEASGTVASKGVEATANYFVSPSFGLNAGWYHTNARWGNTGTDLDLSGRSKALVPPDIITLAAKYGFSGFLRGLSVFGRYQYASATRAEDGGGQTTSGVFTLNGITTTGTYTPVGSNNGLRNIILASHYTIDLGTGYEWKMGAFMNRIQFNVNNVLDKSYVTFSRGVGEPRAYEISWRVSH